MKKKLLIKVICMLLIVVSIFGAGTALAEDRTDIPGGYVVWDGTNYYWINFDELVDSYILYEFLGPDAEGAELAKFYFDTLDGNPMANLTAYVSSVTIKFVSFPDVVLKYIVTEDVDATYLWFNSSDPADATPAFDVITQVMILGPEGTITGSVYVGTDGYIITMPSPGIIIPGIVRLTIDANQTNVHVNLYNPAANECYFIISIILDDSTVLYESDMLLPGESVGDITIAQALAPGQYGASVLYEAFDLDDQSPLNTAEVKIMLIAE